MATSKIKNISHTTLKYERNEIGKGDHVLKKCRSVRFAFFPLKT